MYAKIISLDWNENAIAEITGNIVSGNISVDGSSATRRTCSLTVISDNKNAQLNETYWGLKTKFAVLVGLKNFIDTLNSMDVKQFLGIGIIGLTLGKTVITNFIKSLQSSTQSITTSFGAILSNSIKKIKTNSFSSKLQNKFNELMQKVKGAEKIEL